MFMAALTLAIRMALHVDAQVTVQAQAPPAASLASAAFDGRTLARMGPDMPGAMAAARLKAGVFVGREQYTVDGLPVDRLPEIAAIDRLTVNADPFSVEHGGVDAIRVDVELRQPDRTWRFNATPPIGAPARRDPLTGTRSAAPTFRSAGVSGPVPRLPVTLWVQANQSVDRSAVSYLTADAQLLALDSAETPGKTRSASMGGMLAAGRVTVRTQVGESRYDFSGVGAGGLTASSAGSRSSYATRRMQTSWSVRGGRVTHRGGLAASEASQDIDAASSAQARTYFGLLNTGGAETIADRTRTTQWIAKHVLTSASVDRPWMVGGQIARIEMSSTSRPNPLGHLYLDALDSAIGTLFVQAAPPTLDAAITTGAAFAQATVVTRERLVVRAGGRADWQSGHGAMLSPRVSTTFRAGLYRLSSSAGLFVESWSPALLLETQRRAIETRVISSVDAEAPELDLTRGDRLTLSLHPNAARRRDIVMQTSLARSFGHLDLGVEHTWTRGFSMLGTSRTRSGAGLSDVVASTRHLSRHQLHGRADLSAGAVTVTAHYEYVHSRDDVDALFGLPAREGDLAAEWGRSTGMPSHNLSLVVDSPLPGGVTMYASASASNGRPYSALTGRDPDGLATFVDRDGAPRNSLETAGARNVSLTLSRAVRVPRTRVRVTVGMRADNVFEQTSPLVVAPWLNSAWLGRPLTALPGRSLSFWTSLAN